MKAAGKMSIDSKMLGKASPIKWKKTEEQVNVQRWLVRVIGLKPFGKQNNKLRLCACVCVCLLGGRQSYHIAETFEHLQKGVSLIYFLTGMLHREENYYR